MAKTNVDKSASLESNREQQLRRNMLCRARYAEMSTERKNEFLAQ